MIMPFGLKTRRAFFIPLFNEITVLSLDLNPNYEHPDYR